MKCIAANGFRCSLVLALLITGMGQEAPGQSGAGSGFDCDRRINADCDSFGEGGFIRAPVAPPPAPGRNGAPVELEGYWVSVISEDWRWRVVTPPKGDYMSLPLNQRGYETADQWDPETNNDACKRFGAAGLMRNPLRLHISWQDDMTLRVDTDHGMQKRLFHFAGDRKTGAAPSMQGDSVAQWHESGMQVDTNNLTSGYLRRNGVPYSDRTEMTEFYDRIAAFDEDWLIVTTIVRDPVYLSREYITSSQFKRLPDGKSWNPVPCGNQGNS